MPLNYSQKLICAEQAQTTSHEYNQQLQHEEHLCILCCCTKWILNHFRITKPLTFADCVGDELPLGWEEVYDQQVGVYYIDHINSEYFFFYGQIGRNKKNE